MVKRICCLIILMVILVNFSFPIFSAAADDIVTIKFEDEKFYKAIVEKCGSKINSQNDSIYTIQITQKNLDLITNLHFSAEGITNISGIENFKNLESLIFWNEKIEDFCPIENLTNLKRLSIDYNDKEIEDISFFSKLTNLTYLSICAGSSNNGTATENTIKDISVLSNMVNLQQLNLAQNKISDISPLSNLTELILLNLQGAPIDDISILCNLNNLKTLHLDACGIDDDDLEYICKLTNLTTLYLGGPNYSGNDINNIEPIKKLINLTTLHLDNNNITDITALGNLVNLEELALRGNNITNLEPLSNLTKLTKLNLGRDNYGTGNPISTIEPLKNLINLTELEISMCNVSDISPLASMKKLTDLDLMCNEVNDISALSELTNLARLKLWGNKIKNISPLVNLTKLRLLDIGYNEIMDLSMIEQKEINSLICNSQKTTMTVKKGERVELPPIFIQAKDTDSKIYTDKEFEFTNCTLSEDGKYIVLNDDILNAKVTIGGERYSTNKRHVLDRDARYATLEILIEDTVPPELNTIYSTTVPTNQDVTVTITANEEVQEVTGWSLAEDKKSMEKVYSNNTINPEEVTVKDLSGNEKKVNININNIDKVPPIGEVTYSTTKITNQDVTVTITANEQLQEVAGWKLAQDKKSMERVYSSNTREPEKITIKDLVGNEAKLNINVTNIDKIEPTGGVTYSTTVPTNQDVIVTIAANEKIQEVEGWKISSDQTKLIKTFTLNDSETVSIKDLAGNERKVNIDVINIDKTEIEVEVEYSTTLLTNQDVKATIKSNKKISNVTGTGWTIEDNQITKTFKQNAEEQITIQDAAGNSKVVNIQINNIDKEKPKIEKIEYSIKEITNQNVIVTIYASEKIQEVEGWRISEDGKTIVKEYAKNIEQEKITISDLAGNTEETEITIENIDKIPPELEVIYSTIEETNEAITVKIKANEEIKEVEGWILEGEQKNILTKEFSNNTIEELTVYDLAGNFTIQKIEIDNIKDKTVAPNVIPEAGQGYLIIMCITTLMVISIILTKKLKKYEDVK